MWLGGEHANKPDTKHIEGNKNKMSYYKNSVGNVAKVLRSWGRVVVMTGYKTLFFDDMASANSYLLNMGFYRG